MKKLLVLLLTVFALNSCEEDTTIIDATAEKKMLKVDVCHYDEYTDTWKTISINRNALKAHLAHGDYEGECNSRTYVPDDAFETYLIEEGYDEYPLDEYVLTANIEGVTKLEMIGRGIKDMTGIEDFMSLTFLNLGNNQLTSLDVSKNLNLLTLYCFNNQLTSLDVSKNSKLELLHCAANLLTNLDVSQNTNLRILPCFDNQLTSLDVSKNLKLENLNCGANLLTNLDVSQNLKLEWFLCYDNQLTSLDVSKNTILDYLVCMDNPLTCIQVGTVYVDQIIKDPGATVSPNCGY